MAKKSFKLTEADRKKLEYRRGRLSKKEKAIIKKYAGHKEDKEIADMLQRNPDCIRAYRINELHVDVPDKIISEVNIKYELRQKPFWKELKQQFSETELNLIVYHWTQIIQQFKGDVTATEELQILDLVKMEALSNRAFKQQHELIRNINRTQKLIDDIYDQYSGGQMPEEQKKIVSALQSEMSALNSAQIHKHTIHEKLQKEKRGLFSSLKATRDQRITRIEKSGTNFLDWMKILDDIEVREREGRELQLMDAATKKEMERLGELHTYVTGEIDQPLLTPENVLED